MVEKKDVILRILGEGDNLIGELEYKGVKLHPKIDAATVYMATYNVTKAEQALNEYKKNKENPILKLEAQKAGVLIFEGIMMLYPEDEYKKLMKMNLYLEDFAVLIHSANNLSDMREKRHEGKN